MSVPRPGRRRPPWWPEGEPFPPQGGPRWRGRPPRRFLLFFALGLAFVVALAVAAGTLAAWLVGTALGSNPAPAPVRLAAAAVLVLAVLGLVLAARGFGRIALPVGDLIEAARKIETGDYGARVPERGPRDMRNVARAFNQMTARLDQTETTRRTFLADVAHELRTPLAVIRGQAEGIGDGVYPADAEHLAPILDATRALERLVEDLRTLTLTEAGVLELKREQLDLEPLIADVQGGFQAQAQAAGVTLGAEVSDLPPISADPVRLRAVLGNLLSNAVAHTPRGGSVLIKAAALQDGVEIAVEDTGPGIPDDLLPVLFDRFVKGPGSRGSGLGLAIARDLVEAHGGSISARNRAEGGAALSLRLPRSAG